MKVTWDILNRIYRRLFRRTEKPQRQWFESYLGVIILVLHKNVMCKVAINVLLWKSVIIKLINQVTVTCYWDVPRTYLEGRWSEWPAVAALNIRAEFRHLRRQEDSLQCCSAWGENCSIGRGQNFIFYVFFLKICGYTPGDRWSISNMFCSMQTHDESMLETFHRIPKKIETGHNLCDNNYAIFSWIWIY